MASPREIRRRIRSVKNIAKVTKAMETVAAAKMRKAQQQVLATRPFATKSWQVLTHLARLGKTDSNEHPLLVQRPIERIGLLLITGDRGLAGAYNSNILRMAAQQIHSWEMVEQKKVELVTVGRKGRDWMLRYGPPLRAEFSKIGDRPSSNDIAPIASILIDDFTSGRFDAVFLAYTDFHNTLRQEPVIRQLLPITPAESSAHLASDYIFEPDPRTILGEVLRGLTELQILQSIYESIASEESARMVAMRNATESANELMDALTLTYNKARQDAITRELLDIVGGSSALAAAA
jgi:F-type H+-transporting ATPase subunit gamma